MDYGTIWITFCLLPYKSPRITEEETSPQRRDWVTQHKSQSWKEKNIPVKDLNTICPLFLTKWGKVSDNSSAMYLRFPGLTLDTCLMSLICLCGHKDLIRSVAVQQSRVKGGLSFQQINVSSKSI